MTRPTSLALSLTFVIACASLLVAQDDALRHFFKDNNRLILVNPFPESVPLGLVVRPDKGEVIQVDKKCFAPYQEGLGSPEVYQFVDQTVTKRRNISAAFLQHFPTVNVGDSKQVSISVLDGKHVVMAESAFRGILENPGFPDQCRTLVQHNNYYIVYEVITGRLSFTFWRKVSGEWQSNNIQLLSKVRTAQEDKSSGKVGADEKVGAVWESTAEGGIQMKEPRVLAVHARRWSKSSAEFDKPMSFFQFNQLHNLNWNLVQNQ